MNPLGLWWLGLWAFSGLAFPSLDFAGEKGEPFLLSRYRGAPFLANFMATFCSPCIQELPALNRLHQRFASQGFAVVGFVMDVDSPEDLKAFRRRYGIVFPLYYPRSDKGMEVLPVPGFPTSFVVGADGTIIKRVVGPQQWDNEEWIRFFEALLPELEPTGDPSG